MLAVWRELAGGQEQGVLLTLCLPWVTRGESGWESRAGGTDLLPVMA